MMSSSCLTGGMFFENKMWMIFIMIMMMILLNFNFIMLGGMMNMQIGILMDSLNLMVMILTIWICLMIFVVKEVWSDKSYKSLMGIIMMILIMCFFVSSIFWFYIFFELVLIPMFLLVILYGNYSERLESAFYMLFYTMLGSLPLLISMMGGFNSFSWSFSFSILSKMELSVSGLGGISMLMAFFSKLPMYGFHIWLPKAHVEAPSVGSSILAGVLLKLGGYGILRILYFLEFNVNFKGLIMIIGIVGGINCGLACLRQNDIKKLVAYSSVGHMGISLSGMMTYFEEGWVGGVEMLICHGLCSSGLFFFVNMIYERVVSRSMLLIKGVSSLCPSGMMWYFLLVIINLGCPPFLAFFSESMLCMSLMKWNLWLMVSLMGMLFISVSYNIYFYSMISHGGDNLITFSSVTIMEYLLLFLHFCPALWLILKMDGFIYL